MERVGLGAQFPDFLQRTTAPSPEGGSRSEMTVNPEGINATISQIYQTVTTIDKVYGPKVLQTAP
jgi:hypothetical protein